MSNGNIPPHNDEAERNILGACLLSGDIATDVVGKLSADDFYHTRHKEIFRAISRLVAEGKSPDLITVYEAWENPDAQYLSGLTDMIPMNIELYCDIVRDKSIRRAMISMLSEIVRDCYESTLETSDLVDSLNQTALKIPSQREASGPVHISSAVGIAIDEISRQYANKEPVTGISTGLADLDSKMSGLQKGEYIILAGRPGTGKTSLALKFADQAAADGEGVLFFSLEMKAVRLVKRILAAGARVPGTKMKTGHITESNMNDLVRYANLTASRNIYLDDTPGLTITELTARAKRIAMQSNIGLVIVDYVQLARGLSNDNRVLEVGQISSGLLALAKDLNVAVVALSQLNRNVEHRTNKRPTIADLKESGALEQDADVVLMLYRDELYNSDSPLKGIAEIIIAKGRDIGNWTVKVGFNGERTEFFDLAKSSHQNNI